MAHKQGLLIYVSLATFSVVCLTYGYVQNKIILLIYKGGVLLQDMKLLILQLFEVITYSDPSVASVYLIVFLDDLLGLLNSEQDES